MVRLGLGRTELADQQGGLVDLDVGGLSRGQITMGDFSGAFIFFSVTGSDIGKERNIVDTPWSAAGGGSAAIPVLQIIGAQSPVNRH